MKNQTNPYKAKNKIGHRNLIKLETRGEYKDSYNHVLKHEKNKGQ